MKDFFKVMGKAFAIAFGSVSALALVLVLLALHPRSGITYYYDSQGNRIAKDQLDALAKKDSPPSVKPDVYLRNCDKDNCGVYDSTGSVPIPVEKEKAYSPEKSVKEKARNLLTGGSGHRRNTPWRRLALLEKWAKRVPYERGWR